MLDSFKQPFYFNREILHLIADPKTVLVFPSPPVGEGEGEGEHSLCKSYTFCHSGLDPESIFGLDFR